MVSVPLAGPTGLDLIGGWFFGASLIASLSRLPRRLSHFVPARPLLHPFHLHGGEAEAPPPPSPGNLALSVTVEVLPD